jgi:hypothetical protein
MINAPRIVDLRDEAAEGLLREISRLQSLSRPSRERRGPPPKAVGGEGLAEPEVQTLTSQASLGPLLSREERERD